MKSISNILLLCILVLNVACSQSNQAQAAVEEDTAVQPAPVPAHQVLSKADFKAAMAEEGLVLLDVRRPAEFAEGHIEGAVNVNVLADDFQAQLQGLNLDSQKKVLVYCRSGSRSGRASKVMEEMGFTNILDLEGGYLGWVKD
jgi:rhodanese-related sulfurtransferase